MKYIILMRNLLDNGYLEYQKDWRIILKLVVKMGGGCNGSGSSLTGFGTSGVEPFEFCCQIVIHMWCCGEKHVSVLSHNNSYYNRQSHSALNM